MAHSLIQHASGMATSLILRELRGVPEECPNCGLPHLEPEQGENTAAPGVLWERPRCADCGWTGRSVPILDLEHGQPNITREGEESDAHSIMTVPLRTILKPGNLPIESLKKTETGPPEPVVYFAYGSNMATARLRKRMPSCKPLGKERVITFPAIEFIISSAGNQQIIAGSAKKLISTAVVYDDVVAEPAFERVWIIGELAAAIIFDTAEN